MDLPISKGSTVDQGSTKVQSGLERESQMGGWVDGNWIVFLSAHMVTQFKNWQG